MVTLNSKTWTIYALTEPDTGEIRYVGKTERDLIRRLSSHITEARSVKANVSFRKNRWIKKLLAEGKRPQIIPLETGDGDWEEAEIRHIAEKKKILGDRLVNLTQGGSVAPPALHTKEAFAKSAASRKGIKMKPRSEEHRENISKALKGRIRPQEMIEKQRVTMTGKIYGPNSWKAILSQRKAKMMKKYGKSSDQIESMPEYFTTPEMILLSLGKHSGVKSKVAIELKIPVNMVRYYDPRDSLYRGNRKSATSSNSI